MVKTAKLRGTIVEKSTTQEAIADLIGIDRSTFYRKMKNDGNFTLKEAKDIKEALNLTNEEAIDIFLLDRSHKCDKTFRKDETNGIKNF